MSSLAFLTPYYNSLIGNQSSYHYDHLYVKEPYKEKLRPQLARKSVHPSSLRRSNYTGRQVRTRCFQQASIGRNESSFQRNESWVGKTITLPTMTADGSDVLHSKGGRKQGEKDEDSAEHGMVLRRDDLAVMTRNGRTAKLTRWTTLTELDIRADELCYQDSGSEDASDSDGERRLDVKLAVQPVGKDFRVMGKLSTQLQRTCDRCTRVFEEEVDGKFEVVLDVSGIGDFLDSSTSDDFGKKGRAVNFLLHEAEAIEPFPLSVDEIDLSPHARDAVLLGVPTRAICDRDCVGISIVGDDEYSSVRYGGTQR